MKTVLAMLLVGGMFGVARAERPYIEAQTGILGANTSIAPIYGIRGGVMSSRWDLSAGYWAAREVNNSDFISRNLSLHTLNAEVYRVFNGRNRLRYKAGAGLGYTIPNLAKGNETADNGYTWVLGGGAEYAIDGATSIGLTVKGFFFTTNTHVTTYGFHNETLSTGQVVEVVDVSHHDNRVNLNSVLIALSLRWR